MFLSLFSQEYKIIENKYGFFRLVCKGIAQKTRNYKEYQKINDLQTRDKIYLSPLEIIYFFYGY